jgi:hypothetical protein
VRVIICANKRGLPTCAYVSRHGFLTYDRSKAYRFKSEKDAQADLEYQRTWKTSYVFSLEPAVIGGSK